MTGMPDLRAEIIEQGQGGYQSGRELRETRSRGYLRRRADERGGAHQGDGQRGVPFIAQAVTARRTP